MSGATFPSYFESDLDANTGCELRSANRMSGIQSADY
jgi:hypothetical protein